MLSKVVIYSFAAIALGIALMLFPIYVMLFFPASYQLTTSETPTLAETATPNKDIMGKISVYNATRDLSTLSEAAQFYGKADITFADAINGDKIGDSSLPDFSSSMLMLTVLVALAGLFAFLLVKLVSGRFNF
ncbi:MAG: hypothetical protein QXK89_02740 [Candidatus Bathyarchaeia archaeon]